MATKNDQDFLFGGMEANDETMSVFDNSSQNNDGLYRPNLKDAKDKNGYRAKLRFLPNILENGKIGPSAIEKHIHYVDFKNEATLSGYYDCRKNYETNCELCTEYWRLNKSKNQADVEKSKLINRTTKYYSYVLIMEDEQHPELVGKIMVFPYGFTIKEKINAERTGEVTGVNTNIFDLAKGKPFKLIIKEKAGFQNYDASQFLDSEPIQLFDEKTETWKPAPVEDGLITNPKAQAKIKDFLQSKTVNIDEHRAVQWDDEMKSKVSNVLSILNGKEIFEAEQRSSGKANVGSSVNSETTNADDFFDLDDE